MRLVTLRLDRHGGCPVSYTHLDVYKRQVGAAGTIIHWNGGFWNRLDVPYAGIFNSVWVDESDDAWVAGGTEAGVGVEASAKIYACKNIKPDINGRECQEIPTGTNGMSVSYTHLDVYKRQALRGSL